LAKVDPVKLRQIRVQNFKGFKDSGPLNIAPDFTVIVGKNNSGKSALLQSFRLQAAGSFPHRSPSIAQNLPPDPNSSFEVTVSFDWSEIQSLAALHASGSIYFPVDQTETNRISNLSADWHSFVSRRPVELALRFNTAGATASALHNPSHQQFAFFGDGRPPVLGLNFRPTTGEWAFGGITGNQENLPHIADRGLATQIFVFDPERLNIDMSQPAHGQFLTQNASNLPSMLLAMQANPELWDQFKHHITDIFPSITSITTPPAEQPGTITIAIWTVDTATRREDLAVRLKDCGTGIGQVLAILHVAMTRRENLVVIDEPNSFLHPGAARKLIEVLRIYDSNQYIVSTHSVDLIAAIQPEVIHHVQWDAEKGESRVDQIDATNLDVMSAMMRDLGIRLSDVFGADHVVWVEGDTEALCFPYLARLADSLPPSGTVFAPVRATGDFDKKGIDAKLTWEVYSRLTKGPALLPPVVAFSFDREGRTDRQMQDLVRQSEGCVHFAPRRLLENHFLHPGALAKVISDEFLLHGIEASPPTEAAVAHRIGELSTDIGPRNDHTDWKLDEVFVNECHGANVLAKLFTSYGLTYSKTRHGQQLAKTIATLDPDHLNELVNYLGLLWATHGTAQTHPFSPTTSTARH
jgi:predicted ATPase